MTPELEPTLQQELQDLIARRDIHAALTRYMRAQDRLLPELHLSAFHADAQVDCGLFAGSAAEFVDFAQTLLGQMQSSHHLIGQTDIQIDGNCATGEVYFIAQHRIVEAGVEKDLFVSGRYHDRYENRGDGWKIAARKEIIDWARTDPATDSFLGDNPGLPRGQRGAHG
jgi:hypothetical protein